MIAVRHSGRPHERRPPGGGGVFRAFVFSWRLAIGTELKKTLHYRLNVNGTDAMVLSHMIAMRPASAVMSTNAHVSCSTL